MARRVTLTYCVTVADGDDDECTWDAETEILDALSSMLEDFQERGIERTVKLEPSVEQQSPEPK